MKKHLKIVGLTYFVWGCIYAAISIVVAYFCCKDTVQLLAIESKGVKEWKVLFLLWGVLIVLLIISAGYIVVGKSIRAEKKWALGIIGYILAIIALPSFPVGTAIGIYAIWSLSLNLREKKLRIE